MTKDKSSHANKGIMVVGGGIAGITTSIEAAEMGHKVFLIEKNPYLGGRVAQLNKYFPKLCPPTCGLEINFKRIKDNKNIEILTLAEVKSVAGLPGNYHATIEIKPRFVNDNCTCCGDCYENCKTEIYDDYNLGMSKTKAARLPFEMAFPNKYIISDKIANTNEILKLKKICKYNAIDPNMKTKVSTISVGSVVWATGWTPYNPNKIDNLGFGKYPNVITNMMLERLASKNGPTNGEISRPSDGKIPKSVAFVQCAGSRDENHLPYCSYICCMASLKQVTYINSVSPDTKIYIFYIDIRSPGNRYEKFYKKIKENKNVTFIKGKVAEVSKKKNSENITVVAENAITNEKINKTVDMVVLATGMEPSVSGVNLPKELICNEDGFIVNDFDNGGMFAAGCANKPADVMSSNQNATGMALKAIQTLTNRQ